jgi:ABC-type sugar transport system permease subunit
MILQGSRSGRLAFVLLVLPALGLMLVLMIWPLANGVMMSFTNASPLQRSRRGSASRTTTTS